MRDDRVRYARNGDVHLAYRIFGDSGPTVIWVPGWMVSDVDAIDEPGSPYAAPIERMSQHGRLVVWDRRGTGLSDPSAHLLSLQERLEDLVAIVDAVGVERFGLFGSSEGGAVSILYAATYPERVSLLALLGTAARFSQDLPDFPWGFTAEEVQSQLAEIENDWGRGALVKLFYGPTAEVPGMRDMFGKLQRSVSSPSMARLWWQAFMDTDVRAVLSAVRAPTLVLAREGDDLVPVASSAALAAGMPNARFHMLPPGPHTPFDVADVLIDALLDFFTGESGAPAEERVLKTVVFTDIVSSTEKLSAVGDSAWRQQLNSHDAVVDSLLSRFDGIRAKHTGDGVFALFDAPTKAARCMLEMVPALAGRGIAIRAGIHTGECERRGDEWSGVAVHIGARIGALAGAGEVLASRTVRDLSTGSGLAFETLGPRQLKGLPEPIEVFRVTR
ncbi:adenylate/guanylate cyclase domain-containing protein [Mycobacterium bourgelatii]|uniref:Hydrolase n=1 Tax=Mycobacterium bourgelatii TaxID=1273442 RepID=A0A7I9YUY5_MYCBU|nr:adenylate/guanylate cyclase domain-containing protein [Mycobacterium bourgelatii]MCV6974779.1 adenylate/guanylate cyclase domain-containing protein [Mycobacterium bourgelatii]GFG92392.1 hydrolase [Mycobacterium bourgelatii]